MAIDALPNPGVVSVSADVNYHTPVDKGGPAEIYAGLAGEKFRVWDTQKVVVKDTRSCVQPPTLDKNGFQVVIQPTSVKDVTNHETVKTTYYKECEDILKKFTGATRVIPFAFTHRFNSQAEAIEQAKKQKPDEVLATRGPASFCHVDESYAGAVEHLRDNLPPEYSPDELRKSRWAIINLWRPLKVVTRDPLATLDFTSLDPETDLHRVNMIYPTFVKSDGSEGPKGSACEVFLIGANPKHEWYITSHMQPEEVLMLKIFDSKKDGRARCCPHTAVQTSIDDGPPRESIETRCFVSWEDQSVE